MLTHKKLKARALERADVKTEYDRLDEEFRFLDEFLKARAAAGVTQAEVAERIGTTQSAVARLESGRGKHSPSIATLEKYAHALGCRLELRLVNEVESRKIEVQTTRSVGRSKKLCAAYAPTTTPVSLESVIEAVLRKPVRP
jgi:transcriptional regulator with XRE-family HTH domain